MADSDFTVIIVGGSIAGLTLAHCLHLAGIKYAVLEKRTEIAPQEGASVGIMPNGARILEQLALYDAVEKLVEPVQVGHFVFPDGFSFDSLFPAVLRERFGYPIAFLDRRDLLKILYSSLRYKDNVHVNKTVVNIDREPHSQLMRVHTADGGVYKGDLVVGADGVHSRVRAEMWRIANTVQPGLITDKEMDSMTVEYGCIFGMSSPTPGMNEGDQTTAFKDGWTIFITVGKNRRLYWFVFGKLKRIYRYKARDAPRFSVKEAEMRCEEISDEPFWKDITFGDIWKRRENFGMIPLEENLFKSWHHEGIVCIGDSMHKLAPHPGQGANCAMEDAAALSNRLYERLCPKTDEKRTKPTPAELDSLLRAFADNRIRRMSHVYKDARFLMRMQARDGLRNKILPRYVLPFLADLPSMKTSAIAGGGIALDFVAEPKRSENKWPEYHIETRRTQLRIVFILIVPLLVLSFFGYLGTRKVFSVLA
ncbi:hypothetical protein BJX99DRAFT_265805 [Aspergillus californicus]